MVTIRDIITDLTIRAGHFETVKEARQLFAAIGGAIRKKTIVGMIEGVAEIWEFHSAETVTWVSPDELRAGRGGPFDACDIRHWLELAAIAGVPYVPAQVILELTEDETSLLSGTAAIPPSPALKRRLQAVAETMLEGKPHPAASADQEPSGIELEKLHEKLFAAMDDVPEGHMVRHIRAGSSILKGWAGTGLAGATAPYSRLGPSFEVGPGWVRIGNRRRVDTIDKRVVQSSAEGPDGQGGIFVSRPWIAASRWVEDDDIHRAGSPIAGPGRWPCEWRCFVENGAVVGVARYYGWAGGEPSPEDARQALASAALAQKVADEAVRQKAWPRYADIEFARLSERFRTALASFGREMVACTLDFIETADGPVLLEGGPPVSPVGGGHPCAFAGCGGKPTFGNVIDVRGVAFRVMRGVNMAEPKTWEETDRTGCILTWEEARALAAQI